MCTYLVVGLHEVLTVLSEKFAKVNEHVTYDR